MKINLLFFFAFFSLSFAYAQVPEVFLEARRKLEAQSKPANSFARQAGAISSVPRERLFSGISSLAPQGAIAAMRERGPTPVPGSPEVKYQRPEAWQTYHSHFSGRSVEDYLNRPQGEPRLSSAFYKYTPYGFETNGAYGQGLIYSGGLLPGYRNAVRAAPCAFNLNACRDQSSISNGSVANALSKADNAINYYSKVASNPYGGSVNQFLGQWSYPGGYNANYQGYNNFYGGAGSLQNPIFQSVMGYNSSSPYNFASQFMNQYNSYIYQPYSRSNFFNSNYLFFNTPVVDCEEVRKRYDAIALDQLDYYFNDNVLFNQRIDGGYFYLSLIYTDPIFMFYSYELELAMDFYQQNAPSYNYVLALYAEVSSWVNPTYDPVTLKYRYSKRLELEEAYEKLQNETLGSFLADPVWGPWLLSVLDFLEQRYWNHLNDPTVQNWESSWRTVWEQNFTSGQGFSQLESELEELLDDYPEFQSYLDENEQAISEFSQFSTDQEVEDFVEMSENLLKNIDLAEEVSGFYEEYIDSVGMLLGGTDVDVELEWFLEGINALLSNDQQYNNWYQNQYFWVNELKEYHQIMHSEVLPYAINGTLYLIDNNPYYDPQIANLLLNNYTYQVIENASAFFESEESYLRSFYQSSDYENLEAITRFFVDANLYPISNQIDQKRTSFNNKVENLPEFISYKGSINFLHNYLRGQSSSLNQKLNDMESVVSNNCLYQDNPICTQNLMLSGSTDIAEAFQAENEITADLSLQPGANLHLQAGNQIILKAPFHAQSGSILKANIDDCQSPSAATAVLARKADPSRFIWRKLHHASTTSPESIGFAGEEAPLRSHHEFQVYPNPVQDRLGVTYYLTAPAEVELWLASAQGEYIQRLSSSGLLAAGHHALTVDVSQLTTGLYWIVCSREGKVESRQFFKIR